VAIFMERFRLPMLKYFARHYTPMLADALMPDMKDVSISDARADITMNATDLILDRLDRLPSLTRNGVIVTLLILEFSSLLTLGKRFRLATRQNRIRHLDLVSRIPVIPFSQLIRLYRALSLMAFYQDPTVSAGIASLSHTRPAKLENLAVQNYEG
jgi:hypothetical protein